MLKKAIKTKGIRAYNLADSKLLENPAQFQDCIIWEPDQLCVVLGQGSDLIKSVNLDKVEADQVPIYRRPSGGEAVVLFPKSATLVISILNRGQSLLKSKSFFELVNKIIIDGLRELGIENLSLRGISDICINENKILGSAIYKNRDLVFYHGVLNIAGSVDLIERYLKHPVREPDYRNERKHSNFVTSLSAEGYSLKGEEVKVALTLKLEEKLGK